MIAVAFVTQLDLVNKRTELPASALSLCRNRHEDEADQQDHYHQIGFYFHFFLLDRFQ
jgi:hypothetical protein